ncbi:MULTISPECIES: ABC transporter permease [Terrabacter]|jgi:peptide/nickel transport system permease protein|uniref:Peptide ABC transporter permease n=1 Tax=Terrabacter tumescens TaxID=60443 RepID=A0ABQ2I3H4_9MICO|nr:ABC transporter permease [Terrabacter tumescens]WVM96854.1 ABC transporter permease [Terrabacter sp. C0L_2]GGM99129.1 peptide ABC transporter permease [Terrabacter tumescens]
MLTYVLKRIGQTVLTAFLATATVFVLLRMAPGDPAANYAPPNPTSEQLAAIREEFGLDQSIPVQFVTFLQHLFQGDVGTSFFFKRPALEVVMERLPYTITLAVAAIVVTAAVAIPLGVWMARRADTAKDLGANIATIAGQSMPDFWIGFVLLILFAVQLGWFEPAGFTSASSIVLPTVTIAILQIALISRLVRREMVVNLASPYLTVARSRGISERALTWRYAFGNSAIPVVTALGTRFAAMLNGVVIVEVVFKWPGVGELVVNALKQRDFPLIQATVLVTVVLALVVQLLVDLLYPLMDPRVRLGEASS